MQILRSLDDLITDSTGCIEDHEIAFEMVKNKESYEVLLNLVENGTPYREATSFTQDHKYKCRSLAFDVLNSLALIDGVGSFIVTECAERIINMFISNI